MWAEAAEAIDYPDFEKELRIVTAKVPNAPARLAGQVTSFVQELRTAELYKVSGISETLDWISALVALDREMSQFRPYLGLTPEQARARTAGPGEKELLETLAGPGWAGIQMYFQLSPRDLAALRAGERLRYSSAPRNGEQLLPAEVASGIPQEFWSRPDAERAGGKPRTHTISLPLSSTGHSARASTATLCWRRSSLSLEGF